MADWLERLNNFIDALQSGRRPDRGIANTPEELDELRMAARLAGSRPETPLPDPEFLDSLREKLAPAARSRAGTITRSNLLRAAGLWVAGIVSGIGIDLAVRRFRAAEWADPTPSDDQQPTGGDWFTFGPVDQLADQSVVAFDAGAVPTFVIREGDTIRAISRVCTHMGCLLRFNAAWRDLNCPCHGATFDLAGKVDPNYGVRSLPPLPPIDVRVTNGMIYVLGA
ncbi:MAG TPA: Rieske (2Fe-2S) protein [Chloroflexota bacterium]|nr:Rieske (2Fe-2S) protein [Chloroflexota bacterium]